MKQHRETNYQLRAELIDSPSFLKQLKEYCYLNYSLRKNDKFYSQKKHKWINSFPLEIYNYEDNKKRCKNSSDIALINTIELYHNFSPDMVEEGIAFNKCNQEKKKRLRDRIQLMIQNYKSIFLTLTFTDETLSNTSVETRRKYVQRWLKANCSMYVANIDYGKQNEREHYHAVVVPINRLNFKDWHDYGAIYMEHIRKANSDKKLSSYITKLTNHAIKETTRKNLVIYSR